MASRRSRQDPKKRPRKDDREYFDDDDPKDGEDGEDDAIMLYERVDTFIPGGNIETHCLVWYVGKFIDSSAGIRTGAHSIRKSEFGYWMSSKYALSPANIRDIMLDSRDWWRERDARAAAGRSDIPYRESRTAERRQANGASPANIASQVPPQQSVQVEVDEYGQVLSRSIQQPQPPSILGMGGVRQTTTGNSPFPVQPSVSPPIMSNIGRVPTAQDKVNIPSYSGWPQQPQQPQQAMDVSMSNQDEDRQAKREGSQGNTRDRTGAWIAESSPSHQSSQYAPSIMSDPGYQSSMSSVSARPYVGNVTSRTQGGYTEETMSEQVDKHKMEITPKPIQPQPQPAPRQPGPNAGWQKPNLRR